MSKLGRDDLSKDTMMEDWFKQFEELAGSQVYLLECFLFSFQGHVYLDYNSAFCCRCNFAFLVFSSVNHFLL